MSGRGVCECLLLILLVDLQLSAAKPFFFGSRVFCDLFCEDYDDDVFTPSTTTTMDDLFDPCTDCPTRRPPTAIPGFPGVVPPGFIPPGGMPPGGMQPFNFMIPPSNGMNLTMIPNGFGSWTMSAVPWASPGTPNPTNQAATPAPAPTTAEGSTAAAGATTPAAGATTAAPTTAAG